MQHNWQDRIAEKIANKGVGVRGTKPLRVALHTLAPLRVTVVGLTDTGDDTREKKRPRICGTLEEEPKFLSWRKRKGVLVSSGVEGRHHAHDPLMLLLFQLLFGFIMRGFVIGGLLRRRLCGRVGGCGGGLDSGVSPVQWLHKCRIG